MIKIIKGNLLDADVDLLIHGVNAKGKMASGIAKQIKEKWPVVYEDYMHKHRDEGWNLGDVQFVQVSKNGKPHYVVNCCTQNEYGYDAGVVYCDYMAIQECLRIVMRFAQREKYTVGMPRLGCGLANGQWSTVYGILFRLSYIYPEVNVEVYEL